MLTLQYREHGTDLIEEIFSAFHGCYPSDLLLVCADNETLFAHRLVLGAASPLMRKLLADPSILNEGITTIHFPDVPVYYFRLLFVFLYSGETWVPTSEVKNLRELLALLQMGDFRQLDSTKYHSGNESKCNMNEDSDPNQYRTKLCDSSLSIKSSNDISMKLNNSQHESNSPKPDQIVSSSENPLTVDLTEDNDDATVSDDQSTEPSTLIQCRTSENESSDSHTKSICFNQCQYCNKQFEMLTNLKVHLRLHRGDKPFRCQFCTSRFNQKSSLVSHLSFRHRHAPHSPKVADQYICCFCSQRFRSRPDLARHLPKHHNNMLVSDNMNRSTDESCGSLVIPSIQQPDYRCQYCGKSFGNLQNLKIHLLSHTLHESFAC